MLYSSFPGGTEVKNLPANAGDTRDVVRSLGGEEPLEDGMETHSSIFAWRNPWTEEPSGLQSVKLQRVGHDSELTHTHIYLTRIDLMYDQDCYLEGIF